MRGIELCYDCCPWKNGVGCDQLHLLKKEYRLSSDDTENNNITHTIIILFW
jgi:hypothetical protein